MAKISGPKIPKTVRMDEETHQMLLGICEAHGHTQATVMREAIRLYQYALSLQPPKRLVAIDESARDKTGKFFKVADIISYTR